METVFMAKFRPRKNKSERSDLPQDLLVTEFEVRTVTYGPRFFSPFYLWHWREERGPWIKEKKTKGL